MSFMEVTTWTLNHSRSVKPMRSPLLTIVSLDSNTGATSRGLIVRELRTRHPEPRKARATTPKLAPSECVLSLRYPIKYGPAKPPSCPTELISPNVAAAADSLRRRVGIDQKHG